MTKSKLAGSGLFMKTGDMKRFFKASFEGFAGSGKSFTMGMIARGMWEREGGKSPVVIIDTEESSKFLIPLFTEVGMVDGENIFVSRSRTLTDYEKILKLAEEEEAILLIDSLTHIHEEMVKQYLLDNRRRRIEMKDYMVIKPFWKEHFSNPFVRANCHVLFTGRAAWEYEAERDEETGKIKDFVRSGVKMRGDNETAFEPDLLVLMQRCQEVNGQEIKVWREATVMKSRYDKLDGKVMKNPTFEDFESVYQFVMTGKTGNGSTPSTSMAGVFSDPSQSGYARRHKIDELLGELKGLYDSYLPGTGARERKLKADIAFTSFGKRSWEALEGMKLEELQDGYPVAEYLLSQLGMAPEDVKEIPAWLARIATEYRDTREAVAASENDITDVVPPPAPQSDATISEPLQYSEQADHASPPEPEGVTLATQAQIDDLLRYAFHLTPEATQAAHELVNECDGMLPVEKIEAFKAQYRVEE